MSRLVLVFVSLMLSAAPALADICGLVTKSVADQAIAMIRRGSTVMEYCKACGDKKAVGTYVASIEAEQSADTPDMYSLILNKDTAKPDDIDPGYTFILGGKGNKEWVNLGRLLKCSDDESYYEFKVLPLNLVQKGAILPSVKPD